MQLTTTSCTTTRSTTTRSTVTGALGAATLAVLGLSACTTANDQDDSVLIRGVDVDPAADTSPQDGVRLLTAGATDRISLPVGYGVGDAATTEMTLDMVIGLDGDRTDAGMQLTMTQTVTDATGDVAQVETSIDRIRGTGVLAGAGGIEEEFADIVGVPLVGEVDAAGLPVGELRRIDDGPVPASFSEQMSQIDTEIDFPTEPVGVGAVWTATTEVEENGITVVAETRFDLVELSADEYVVEITQRVPIDERVEGIRVEGLLEASGTLTVDRDNPLHVEMEYIQTGSYSADGLELSLDLDLTLDSV